MSFFTKEYYSEGQVIPIVIAQQAAGRILSAPDCTGTMELVSLTTGWIPVFIEEPFYFHSQETLNF